MGDRLSVFRNQTDEHSSSGKCLHTPLSAKTVKPVQSYRSSCNNGVFDPVDPVDPDGPNRLRVGYTCISATQTWPQHDPSVAYHLSPKRPPYNNYLPWHGVGRARFSSLSLPFPLPFPFLPFSAGSGSEREARVGNGPGSRQRDCDTKQARLIESLVEAVRKPYPSRLHPAYLELCSARYWYRGRVPNTSNGDLHVETKLVLTYLLKSSRTPHRYPTSAQSSSS